jgi:hypothetical protein
MHVWYGEDSLIIQSSKLHMAIASQQFTSEMTDFQIPEYLLYPGFNIERGVRLEYIKISEHPFT